MVRDVFIQFNKDMRPPIATTVIVVNSGGQNTLTQTAGYISRASELVSVEIKVFGGDATQPPVLIKYKI